MRSCGWFGDSLLLQFERARALARALLFVMLRIPIGFVGLFRCGLLYSGMFSKS